MNNFIYGIRTKDLKQKYFGDIVSEQAINTKAKVKKQHTEDDKLLRKIQNEINKRTARTNKKGK